MTDRPVEPHAALEFHDSTLLSIGEDALHLVAILKGYIHRSQGNAGVDPGTGWSQTAELRIAKGQAQGPLAALPMRIADGDLESAGVTHSNTLAVGHIYGGPIRLALQGIGDASVVVHGERLEVLLRGSPVFLEDFPGSERELS